MGLWGHLFPVVVAAWIPPSSGSRVLSSQRWTTNGPTTAPLTLDPSPPLYCPSATPPVPFGLCLDIFPDPHRPLLPGPRPPCPPQPKAEVPLEAQGSWGG